MLVANAEDLVFTFFSGIWSARSSENPEQWTADNPSCGQAPITALAIQKYLGGDIAHSSLSFRNDNKTESHFWNIIGEEEIDATYDQFADSKIRDHVFVGLTSKETLLENPQIRQRYEVFLEALKDHDPSGFFLTLKLSHTAGH